MGKKLSPSSKRKLVERIGSCYRRSRKRQDLMNNTGCIRENARLYHADADLIYLVDRTLKDCTKDTQNIIRHEFLEVSDPYWYEAYYSRSTFYRLKREAIDEFLKSQDI